MLPPQGPTACGGCSSALRTGDLVGGFWRFWVEQSQLQPSSGGPSVDTWCPVWSRDDAPSGPWSGPAPTAPGGEEPPY